MWQGMTQCDGQSDTGNPRGSAMGDTGDTDRQGLMMLRHRQVKWLALFEVIDG